MQHAEYPYPLKGYHDTGALNENQLPEGFLLQFGAYLPRATTVMARLKRSCTATTVLALNVPIVDNFLLA